MYVLRRGIVVIAQREICSATVEHQLSRVRETEAVSWDNQEF